MNIEFRIAVTMRQKKKEVNLRNIKQLSDMIMSYFLALSRYIVIILFCSLNNIHIHVHYTIHV